MIDETKPQNFHGDFQEVFAASPLSQTLVVLRESADDYPREICRAAGPDGLYRAIICRDGIQFILQRRSQTAGRPVRGRWRAIAYLTTRESL